MSTRQKKITMLTLCAILFALCFPVEAQQAGKIPRLGFLDTSTASASAVRFEAFWQEICNLGWVEGKNITIEYRFAEQDNKRLPELAADLVRLKVDLIVVVGSGAAVAAKSATTTIPIVLTAVGDPVAAGLIASLARPGGNVTGLSSFSPELAGKRLEVLKDAIPRLSRVGLLAAVGRRHRTRPPTERVPGCGSGTEAKVGGDRDSTGHRRLRESFSNREAETGRRDYYDSRAAHFRPKKTDRRACHKISVACYLLPEGVYRRGWSHILRGRL
jgi:hypothetical protein